MKLNKSIGTVLLAAMTCFALSSCGGDSSVSPEPTPTPTPTEDEEFEISIGITGEVTVEESPLTRAIAAGDLCAITVKQGTANYAYGLFDGSSLSGLKLKVKKGYSYSFEATLVKSGTTLLKKNGNNYGLPFSAAVGTAFTYSTSAAPYAMSSGKADLTSGTFDHPVLDRFYGKTDAYNPERNGTVSINMRRAVYGLKFTTEDFVSGSLSISISGSPTVALAYPTTSTGEIVYSFGTVSSVASNDAYQENITVSVVWTKADNSTATIVSSKQATVKRNTLSTLNIKVNGTADSGLSITANETTLAAGSTVNLN